MAPRPSRMVAVGVALVWALSVGAGPAGAVIPSGNLLANPGAEDGAAAPGGLGSVTIPGWTQTMMDASPTVVGYGSAGGFPDSTNRSATGNQFFAGGSTSANSGVYRDSAGMTQNVDVSGVTEIGAGNVQAVLSGCLGGYLDQDDYAELTVRASTSSSGGLSGSLIGLKAGPNAAARGYKTALLPVSLAVNVPASTKTLSALIYFFRQSGPNTYNDGYADNLQLTLSPAGSAAPNPLPCPKPAATSPGGTPGSGGGGKQTGSAGTNAAVGIARLGKRLTLKGSDALVKLRCTLHDSKCKGTLGLAAAGLPKAHKSVIAKNTRASKLGAAKFTIAAGKTKTVKVHLSRSIRRRLAKLSHKRLKKLKITVTAKTGAGTTKFTLGAVRKR